MELLVLSLCWLVSMTGVYPEPVKSNLTTYSFENLFHVNLVYRRFSRMFSFSTPPTRAARSANLMILYFIKLKRNVCRSQWLRGLRRRSAAARLLRLWVRIRPGAWMFVCCECCVLSGRGLCDGLITRPEEFYRLWCVVMCDIEKTSRMRRP